MCCCILALLKDITCCSWRDLDEALQGHVMCGEELLQLLHFPATGPTGLSFECPEGRVGPNKLGTWKADIAEVRIRGGDGSQASHGWMGRFWNPEESFYL